MKDYISLLYHIIVDLFHVKRKYSQNKVAIRRRICNKKLYVNIHEWGGYEKYRRKHINSKIQDWDCGLMPQIERFASYCGSIKLDLTITISDIHLYSDADYECVTSQRAKLITVPNVGMDFSGYSTFYKSIKDKEDCYVLLTNTSVNARQVNFIDDYIGYMQNNLDVGILGISCCSKCYQTIVRNNFTPHLQSFFLLTTIGVLNEIVNLNNGKFPGEGISNKQLLIRNGEIKISQLALRLGYKLAVVTEYGPVKFDNNRLNWPLPIGDYRYYTKFPNSITQITKC